MKTWLIAQLKQPSTWRGLVWILTVFGVLLTPEQTEAIVLAGMALAGLLGVFLNDAPQTVKIERPPIDLVNPPASGRLRDPMPPEFDPNVDGNGFGDK
jgi:hypothetical protein